MNPFIREDIVEAVLAGVRAQTPLPVENDGLPVVHQSPRARAIRRISDIANSRGWQLAVVRTLDRYGATYVSDLSDEQVLVLLRQLQRYEDCAEVCCDPDDSFPAR